MPQYFFHVRNGSLSSQDDEGSYFHNFALAEREAEMSVRDLIIEAVKRGDLVTGWKIEITDVDGRVFGPGPGWQSLALAPQPEVKLGQSRFAG